MPPWDSDTWIVPELPAMSLQHASSWRRLAITGLLATLTIAGFSCDGAEARTTHHRPQAVHQVADKRVVHGPKYHPPYSAIVIDNNSGQVLHDENADDLRHPASLTKIMTPKWKLRLGASTPHSDRLTNCSSKSIDPVIIGSMPRFIGSGELLLRNRNGTRKPAADFERALQIARKQEGKLFELRAAISLARLWRDQHKRAEARDLLAPIYSWFSSGFDMPDLVAAKALLNELAS